jgi:HrpA-like RNA helicase
MSKDTSILSKIIVETDGSKTVQIEEKKDYMICPLYAAMPPDEQLKVFNPAPFRIRKFILSTNIAETSVTISGIKYGELWTLDDFC